MEYIYTFDEQGLFTGQSLRPWDPVRCEPAMLNELVATCDPAPVHDPVTQRCRRVGSSWVVEEIPAPEKPAEPEPLPPQFPHFLGNAKLDLFTQSEQLAVVTAAMTDPVVKLMYDRLIGAAFWTYEDPETEQGLSLLVSKGLLTAARKAEIVAQMQPV